MLKKRFIQLLLVLFVINCSSNNKTTDRNQKIASLESSEALYIQAMIYFDEEKYSQALSSFSEIIKIYPLSNEAIQSQIMSAFIDYINLNYDDAIYKFNRIINNYPSLKNIDYVYYMKAMCYYEQINHEGLDGENNFLALNNFNEVIQRFPKSDYAKDSKQKIILVKSNIAAKHMNIARYYQNKNKYTASLNRYKIVIDKFSMTKFTPEALYRMTEIYFTIGMFEEAKNTASVIGYNYPDSKWYQLSYDLINAEDEKKGIVNKIKNLF